MTPLARVGLTLTGLRAELAGAWRLAADRRSRTRFIADALGYRLARVIKVGDERRHRSIAFKDGTRLTYRFNRGDVRAIAETWMTGAYELPVTIAPRYLIDLGANIGSTSVWLARRYGIEKVVAVEPAPGNAELVRINLAANGIDAEVIEAAIGSREGTAHFDVTADSTLGGLSDTGIEVKLVTPQSLIDRFPADAPIGLVKMDVEGAEGELFEADLAWLDRVECLVAEIHADRVDAQRIIGKLEALGFTHTDISDNAYCGLSDLMAVFVRSPVAAPA